MILDQNGVEVNIGDTVNLTCEIKSIIPGYDYTELVVKHDRVSILTKSTNVTKVETQNAEESIKP